MSKVQQFKQNQRRIAVHLQFADRDSCINMVLVLQSQLHTPMVMYNMWAAVLDNVLHLNMDKSQWIGTNIDGYT